jgi:hypothetical protein
MKRDSAPDNLPVFARRARWRDSCTAHLRAALSVNPSRRLLGVRRAGKNNIGKRGTEITVVTLVDDKCILRNRLGVDVVCVEEVDKLGLSSRRLLRGYEANVVRRRARGSL